MRHSSILVMLSFLFFSSARARRSVPSEDDLTLERELKMLNKPYVKSFKDNYGVIFDCVDMYKQSAFDHPLLKNHKVQITPSSSSGTDLPTAGEICPYGTVPIRRTLKEDLFRECASSQVYKPQRDTSGVHGQHLAQVLLNSEKSSPFSGASAVIEVYPLTIPPGQASTAQILLVDDSSSNVSVVQAGWHVDPDLEGDGQNRFMVYWTADDYQSTSCLNVRCPGFVVWSRTTTPGMVLPKGSITLNVTRDGQTGDWRVYLNQDMVGYFPNVIVNTMSGSTQVQMGGTVYAPTFRKSPNMGSGVTLEGGQGRGRRELEGGQGQDRQLEGGQGRGRRERLRRCGHLGFSCWPRRVRVPVRWPWRRLAAVTSGSGRVILRLFATCMACKSSYLDEIKHVF